MAVKKLQIFLLDNMIWFINLVLMIIFISIEPGLLTPKNLISMIYSVSMLGLLVYAQAIVLISGNFDLSVGAIAGISMTVLAVMYEFWTPGMNSFGTAPPTTFASNEKPSPCLAGATLNFTRANWPDPPVCFLWV